MFTVITLAEPQKKRKLFKSKKSKAEASQIAVRSGAPFQLVKLTPGRNEIDWQRLAALAGCGSQNVILSAGLKLPNNHYLKPFKADTLPLLLMLNTAAAQLSRNEAAKKRRLLIVDKNAVLPDYIDKIVLSAAKIKIVTNKPENYYSASLRIMEQHGAALTVCDSIGSGESFDVCIAENEYACSIANYSADKIGTPGFMLEVPGEHLQLCPPGINTFDFTCALFECSGVKSIGELILISEEKGNII